MFLNEIFGRVKTIIVEGGNSELPNLDDPSQPHQAQHIDLRKLDRDDVLPAVDGLLAAVNSAFQQSTGKPLWSPGVLRDRKHTSGSTFHFLDPKIPSSEFVKYKPSVGDIDTMVDRASKDEIEKFLQSIRGKMIGNYKLLNYDEESETGRATRLKQGKQDKRAQFITQWEIVKPFQFKGLQLDLELSDFEEDPTTGEMSPTDWATFSHSSSWDDIQNNVKGVFHKWFIQSLTTISSSAKHRVDVLKTKTKIGAEPEIDNDTGFAVASGQGGGMSQKYEPYTDPTTGEKDRGGVPLKRYVPPEQRTYVKNLDQQFQMLFGNPPAQGDGDLYKSFTGCIALANKYLTPPQLQSVANDFVKTCFDLDAQMITKNDPEADAKIKMAAIDYMTANLKGINAKGVTANANQMLTAYAKDHYDLQAFKAANPLERQPRAAMRKAQMAPQPMNEAEEQPAVKAQLRKNMPHLKDLKPLDFLDLLDELHDGNGNFKLQNIPLNVKVDGFGGRFGKNTEGKPFMGTSNTEPRYKAGFVDYHKQKGTTDPDVLARSQLFDDLFSEMMKAISLVDSKLGADFLNDKQVTCEVLFLPFATTTPEGKLKFVGIAYDELPKGVQLALVPFRVVQASTGEEIPEAQEIVKQLTSLGQQGSVMFIDNSLTQNEALDVTAIVPPLENIDEFKSVMSNAGTKKDRASVELRRSVEASLAPIKVALEKAIINDPNIIGKNILGKDYEGIVINSRLGPIKITSQEQRDVISAKQAAKASARQERPRDGQKNVAAVAIGSAVGHMGHQQLFSETIKVANETGGDPYFFIGNAEGKDDPIPVTDKLKTWHMLYPQYAKNIATVTMEGGSLLQKVKHELINPLPGKPPRYSTIYIVVGTDRALFAKQTAAALMKAVTKFPGYEHVQVIPKVTERDKAAGGSGMSFTKMRQALSQSSVEVTKGKWVPTETAEQKFAFWNNAFNDGNFGAKQLPPDWIKHLMDVSKGERFIKKPAPAQALPKQAKPQVKLPQQQEPQASLPQQQKIAQLSEDVWQMVNQVAKANNIKNPNMIRVGQQIKLPDGQTYTVKTGDTLGKIVQRSQQTIGGGGGNISNRSQPGTNTTPAQPAPAQPAPIGAGGGRGGQGGATADQIAANQQAAVKTNTPPVQQQSPVKTNTPPVQQQAPANTGVRQGPNPNIDDATRERAKASVASVGKDGSITIGNEKRIGGTLSWRANNPGNSMTSGLSKQYGSIGTIVAGDGVPTAIFPTIDHGVKLQMDQWRRPKYNNLTIDAGCQQWAEGVKKQGYGSPYARDLAKAAGATLDTKVKDLSDEQLKRMCLKQAKWEGWKVGKIIPIDPQQAVAEDHVNNYVKIGEAWEAEMANAVNRLLENFADGKNPGRKGLAKRSGVNTKASVSSLRKTAKNSTGEKARMAHWLANMKAGKAKNK
jgi:LysM repeat protein/ribosomal protein S13